MEPYFIDLGLDKFQICSCPGCDYDASNEVCAKLKSGTEYYLASCERRGHKKRTQDVKQLLEQGVNVNQLHTQGLINQEEVFIKPPDKDQKCKFLQWQAYKDNPRLEEPPPQPKKLETNNVHSVCKNWKWVPRMDYWMNERGDQVRLSRLPLAQLVSSILAIRDVNFGRVTKRIAWTKSLVEPRIKFTYPKEELLVGNVEAGLKLEEFKEEAEERGLLE